MIGRYAVFEIATIGDDVKNTTNFATADQNVAGDKVLVKFVSAAAPANIETMTPAEAAALLETEEWKNDVSPRP